MVNSIDCSKCSHQGSCCRFGVEVDLDNAMKIARLGLPGHFYYLETTDDKENFPTGFKVGTSLEDRPCEFLCPDGKCAIHKIDPKLKPKICRDFPDYTNPAHYHICVMIEGAPRKKNKSRGVL